MSFDYPQIIGSLTPEQRLYFYELFAHNLTISNRAIWSAEQVTDAEKLERLKLVNEIQHRITSKVYVLRLNLHEWTEEDVWKMIQEYVSHNKAVEGEVGAAILSSYRCIGHSCQTASNNSLDRNGGSVFGNLNGPAKVE